MDLSDRLAMPQHYQRLPALDGIEESRSPRTKVSKRNRFHTERLCWQHAATAT
jgi:hypothetical protein